MVLETPAVTQFASAMAPALSRTVQAFCLAGQTTFVAFSTRKQHLIRLCSPSYPTWDTDQDLMRIPDASEIQRAINQMASGKAPGQDGLPPELFKLGGAKVVEKLVTIYGDIWEKLVTRIQGCPDCTHFQTKGRQVRL